MPFLTGQDDYFCATATHIGSLHGLWCWLPFAIRRSHLHALMAQVSFVWFELYS